ncbi:MAG: SpoIIE family protein phosphatase [Treponema sp.]|jgi:sigma-B regulation protein RsbU (phosphoserine phosphatase)|nr:SpoIIE family protein phosphatase [Treponema sp.]
MKLKTRILIQILSASVFVTLLLSLIFFLSLRKIRQTVLVNSNDLGESAAGISTFALEEQITERIAQIAADTAHILDEKIVKIENHTRMTADIAGTIYTHEEIYRPRPLPSIAQGQASPGEPYMHLVPGVDPLSIQRETDLAGNIGSVLRQITVAKSGITTSTIGSETGAVIVMDAYPWASQDFDPRLQNWYQGAKEQGDLYWTPVYPDLRGRGPAISCGMPFYDRSGKTPVFKGVARSTVMLSDLSDIINAPQVGRAGHIFILDQSGMKLSSSGSVDIRIGPSGEAWDIQGENYLESSNPRLRSLGFSMTLGARGMMELKIDGYPVYVAYAPIETLNWSLGVVIPTQEIFTSSLIIEEQIQTLTKNTMKTMNWHIFVTALNIGCLLVLTLLLAGFISLRFTRALTSPILALNQGVKEVSEGNLDREVVIKTGDELEELARSFNRMTERLRQYISQITRTAAEKERTATELDIATQIQASMLPFVFPPFKDRNNEFDLYAVMHPAKEVGGDFYDFFFIDDDHFAVIIADVAGKGIPAALFMAITKTLIKNRLQTGLPLEKTMEIINRQLCKNNIAQMFVTLWGGVLEISTGRLGYINAGHNPPLLQTKGKGFAFLNAPADLFLAGLETTVYRRQETRLASGDTLFLYTDGVTEAADGQDRFYGKERLQAFLDAHQTLSVRELLPRLREDIEAFAQGTEQSDDITMLVLRRAPPEPVPNPEAEKSLE